MKHGRGLARVERLFGRHDLAEGDAIKRPAMGLGGRTQFLSGFRNGDVEDWLTPAGAGAHELHGERRLARTGDPFYQIAAIPPKPANEDIVESGDSTANRVLEIRPDA